MNFKPTVLSLCFIFVIIFPEMMLYRNGFIQKLDCETDVCHSVPCFRWQEVPTASEEGVNSSLITSSVITCSKGNFVPSVHYWEDILHFKFSETVFSLLSWGMREVRLFGSIQGTDHSIRGRHYQDTAEINHTTFISLQFVTKVHTVNQDFLMLDWVSFWIMW